MAAFNRNITGAQAVIDVMETMGLAAPSSPAGSLDPTAKQMWKLATEVGQQLLEELDWQFLSDEFEINTTPGNAVYPLPADWNQFITDASWNRTTRLPAIGSLKDYEWQMLKARNFAGTTFTMLYRLENNAVVFYEAPSTTQKIVLPYTTRGWVKRADSSYSDALTANDDLVLYDSQLFKAKLKLDWLAEKKFDTTRQQAVYDDLLEKAESKDTPSRTLTIGRGGGYPYLGMINIPDSGYGGG